MTIADKITAQLNGKYTTAVEIKHLFEAVTGKHYRVDLYTFADKSRVAIWNGKNGLCVVPVKMERPEPPEKPSAL